jgi:hypothetical protein
VMVEDPIQASRSIDLVSVSLLFLNSIWVSKSIVNGVDPRLTHPLGAIEFGNLQFRPMFSFDDSILLLPFFPRARAATRLPLMIQFCSSPLSWLKLTSRTMMLLDDTNSSGRELDGKLDDTKV